LTPESEKGMRITKTHTFFRPRLIKTQRGKELIFMNNTKMGIFITLFTCTSQGNNHYSLISVNKIRKLLERYHGTHVERRWVFQCIHDIIEDEYLTRRPRYKRHKNGTINQLSSITAITLKGAKLLVAKKVSGALLLLKRILAWAKNQDKRFPTEKEILPDNIKDIDPKELRRLELLTDKILETV